PPQPRNPSNHRLEAREVDRLGEEAIGGERGQLLVLGIRCGEDDDRKPLPARLFANSHEDVAAVEVGQSQIQQDQVGSWYPAVRLLAPQKRERLDTIP